MRAKYCEGGVQRPFYSTLCDVLLDKIEIQEAESS